eukprot:GHVU01223915.1.p1 GENE.GHVU01223915.1~~GHVU01223915.1.p1  ORF type:complete len:453 (+),score=17.45 GHVU01223915.1:317-1675(+)
MMTPFLSVLLQAFHIPQAQKYCDGDFHSWDPAITTFPGLYLMSAMIAYPIKLVLGIDACTTESLRATNAFAFAPLFGCVVYFIVSFLHPSWSRRVRALRTMRIVLHPAYVPFYFLYYTDCGSLVAILTSYAAALSGRYNWSGVAAVAAVIMRQTNIVWVGGIFLLVLWDMALLEGTSISIGRIYRALWIHCLTMVSFLVFVFVNGSVVLGHHEHHKPRMHLAQVLYVAAYLMAFSGPMFWKTFVPSRQQLKSRALGCLALFATFTLAAAFGTFVHPFIVSDNRNVVFYVWRRILRYPAVRIVLLPLVTAAAIILSDVSKLFSVPLHHRESSKYSRFFHICVFTICVVMTLSTAGLLTVRYFNVPLAIFLLHIDHARGTTDFEASAVGYRDSFKKRVGGDDGLPPEAELRNDTRRLKEELLALLLNVALSCILMCLFLFRAFYEDGELKRFLI